MTRQIARRPAAPLAPYETETLVATSRKLLTMELARMSREGRLAGTTPIIRLKSGEYAIKVQLIPEPRKRTPWVRAGVVIAVILGALAGVIVLVKMLIEALVATTPLLIMGALALAAITGLAGPTVIQVTQSVVIKR